MDRFTVFPDNRIQIAGPMADTFLTLGIATFQEACGWVHGLPYGYNSNRDDILILFKDKMGSCTTKHAVIAALAAEMGLPIHKHICIYAMTEVLVTGTGAILEKFRLPYLPMVHCFLVYDGHRVDLTEGNRNGKNGPIDRVLYAEKVAADISAKDEYRRYRSALTEHVLPRPEFHGTAIKTVLKAREEGIALLRANIR
jgi:hypothetical protein